MPARRLILNAVGLYQKGLRRVRELRGITANDEAARRIVTGQTWEEFCDTLKAAGAAINGMGAPMDPLTQAEGYRYLSRLTRAGLEAFLEYSDPRAPALRRMVHETVKMGADNPDNHYFNATISGEYEYRLRGNRGTVCFLHFATQKGGYGGGGGLPPTGFLDSTEMEVGDDGSFEIAISRDRRPGNWLPMEQETGMLIVRQTFADRASEIPAEVHLERVGDDADGRPTPLSAQEIDRGLTMASNLVAGASLLFAKWARDFQKHLNELPQFDPETSTTAGGDPNIAYYHSAWRLEPDEALVIKATPPRCETWNFQLNNYWMESLDYRYHTIHVNKHTATYEPDGSVRIIVAHHDPGLPNWIDTAGHFQGTMCFRWIRADHHPQPGTKVVKLCELEGSERASSASTS
jgi:hypothetical protein